MEVKDLLAQAHEDHLSSLLNFDNNDERERVSVTKKFWSYVKSKRRDISGVSPLTKDNQEVTDSKGKAEILKILPAYPYYKRRTFHHSPTWTSMSGVSPNYWRNLIHKKPMDPIRFPQECSKSPQPKYHHTFTYIIQ